MYIIKCETDRQSRFDAWNRVLRAGALGWPRGMGWGGRWEGRSGWGTHVYLWRIHVNVWQKPLQYCKVISLQLKKKRFSGLGVTLRVVLVVEHSGAEVKAVTRQERRTCGPPHHVSCILRFSHPQTANIWGKKISESSQRQNLSLPRTGNYLYSIYTVFCNIFT